MPALPPTKFVPSVVYRVLLAISLSMFCAAISHADEARIFTNRSGATIKAEFISEKDGTATIKRVPDRKIFSIPIDTLCDEDKEWIKHQGKAKNLGVEGIWGGKWDDEWPVFLVLKNTDNPGEYSVTYIWRENIGRPLKTLEKEAKDEGGYIQGWLLTFKITDGKGMLYGKFSSPRMANLVRITDDAAELEDINLDDYGWKEGAISPDKAHFEITGRKASEE